MTWIKKVFQQITDAGKSVSYPIKSTWTDNIVNHMDFNKKYQYGKVSFQLRKEDNKGRGYLVIEHRSPEGTIWIPLTYSQAVKIKGFLDENFETE